jgi:hypothetical protein
MGLKEIDLRILFSYDANYENLFELFIIINVLYTAAVRIKLRY